MLCLSMINDGVVQWSVGDFHSIIVYLTCRIKRDLSIGYKNRYA